MLPVLLMLIVFAASSESCSSCDFTSNGFDRADEPLMRDSPFKKDLFRSRGWGAGGSPKFTSLWFPGLSKKARIMEILANNERVLPKLSEPRAEYLRSVSYVPKPKIPRRLSPMYWPQLFVSSGWGPLGK